MDLEPSAQTHLYEGYWFPMEQEFKGTRERRFDEFVRLFDGAHRRNSQTR